MSLRFVKYCEIKSEIDNYIGLCSAKIELVIISMHTKYLKKLKIT